MEIKINIKKSKEIYMIIIEKILICMKWILVMIDKVELNIY